MPITMIQVGHPVESSFEKKMDNSWPAKHRLFGYHRLWILLNVAFVVHLYPRADAELCSNWIDSGMTFEHFHMQNARYAFTTAHPMLHSHPTENERIRLPQESQRRMIKHTLGSQQECLGMGMTLAGFCCVRSNCNNWLVLLSRSLLLTSQHSDIFTFAIACFRGAEAD